MSPSNILVITCTHCPQSVSEGMNGVKERERGTTENTGTAHRARAGRLIEFRLRFWLPSIIKTR